MKEKLKELLKNSYSPYSKIQVAAIVIDNKGNEYKGVNVENASFGGTICAERSAILNAISNGAKTLSEIHMTSSLKNPLYPCGICRQFMTETFDENTKIYIYHDDDVITTSIKQLMPNQVVKGSFGWK